MPTELFVRIIKNPHGCRGSAYEARFIWNGLLNRYSFDLRTELAIALVDDGVEQPVIDDVMDSLDNFEWGMQYPLGVVYVGEAVSDSPVDEPVYPVHTPPYSVGRDMEPPTLAEYCSAVVWMGAVAAPMVFIVLLGRFAWFKAAEWGWM
jgi:hypothetical protein